MPSLVVWGRHDQGVPLASGEEAYALLGAPAERKSLVVLDDADHSALVQQPDAFDDVVEPFLDGLSP